MSTGAPPAEKNPETILVTPQSDRCDNCGTVLEGPYCFACGQKVSDIRRPLPAFLQEALADFFSLDSRVARTLWLLVRTPGQVPRDYVDGRRARYVPPLRLFLFAILTVFAVDWIGELIRGPRTVPAEARKVMARARLADVIEDESDPVRKEALIAARDALAGDEDDGEARGARFDLLTGEVGELEEDSRTVGVELSADDEDTRLVAPLLTALRTNPQRYEERVSQWLPRIYTALGILTSLILKLVYWRRFIAEHLIFSLYLHAALMIGAAGADLLSFTPLGSAATPIYAIAGIVFLPISQHRFYGGRSMWTLVRLFAVVALYAILLAAFSVFALYWAAWTLT